MISIVVYASGNIIKGPTSIDYDNHLRFSFYENEHMCFDMVRTTIYKQLKLLQNNIFLVLGFSTIHEVLVLFIFG
jgi:hypothetical protein